MEKTITFSVSGNEITGKLLGNAHLWTFESDNEYFRNNFNDGRIQKHTIAKSSLSGQALKEIYSAVCEEAEWPGF